VLDTTQAVVVVAGTVISAAAILLGLWIKYGLPRYRKTSNTVMGALETLAGRDEIRDRSTRRLIAPAVPSIGIRMETLETKTDDLTTVVKSLAESHALLDNHEQRIKRLEEDSVEFKAAYVERVVSKAEQAEMWRTVRHISRDPDAVEDEHTDFTD
jgi:hypothetical protein